MKIYDFCFIDGSLSDTAVGQIHGLEVPQKEIVQIDSHRERDRERVNQFVGLNKKSNSTSQLSATGMFSQRIFKKYTRIFNHFKFNKQWLRP